MMREILELKEKAKKDYETKLKDLKAEYSKNVEAIDRVFSLLGDTKESPKMVRVKIKRKAPILQSKKGMATSQIVRKIVDNFTNNFSAHDIRREAETMNPPLEVSKNVIFNVFKIKSEGNEIEVVVKGAGRAPSIYKKTDKYVAQ